MTQYSIEPRTKKYVKGYRFWSFARNVSNKYKKHLLDTVLDSLKIASKNVIPKAAEATGEFIGKKNHWQNCKAKTCNRWKSKKCCRNNYSARKKRKNIKQIRTSIIKLEHYKTSKISNDSIVSKLVTKKWIEVNYFWGGQYSLNKNINF